MPPTVDPEKEPRTGLTVYAKVPPSVMVELTRILKKENRTKSTITYFLLLRGIAAYQKDGLLFTEENEQAFLKKRRRA